MKANEFQDIQDKIEKAKTNKIQAETRIDQIENQWRDEFDGISSLEEAEKRKGKLEKEIKDLEEKKKYLMEEVATIIEENE